MGSDCGACVLKKATDETPDITEEAKIHISPLGFDMMAPTFHFKGGDQNAGNPNKGPYQAV